MPTNPSLALTGGLPIEPSVVGQTGLWSATLSQELEIAGQRGRRLDVVTSEQRAQSARVTVARRAAAADAFLLYFDALAAIEEARLGERLARLASALTGVARGRAEAGVAAGVDAQLAAAAATRFVQAQLAARQRVAATHASLATALGLEPERATLQVAGELAPVDVPEGAGASLVERAMARRAEVGIAVAESEAQQRRVALYQRLRVPNPTFSLFARNDWIGERTAGIGIAFPIPLPSPVGRTYAGEIAEASALAARAETEAERLRRSVRLEVVNALASVAARKAQLALYLPEQVEQSEVTLRSIAEEIEARRLPVREALLTQQALIDYLFAYVEAKRQLCFASVELARAAGVPLEESVQ